MKTLNWRLAFAALIACVSALGLAGCPQQQDEPDDTSTTHVDIDNTDDNTDDADPDDVTDDANDEDLPGDDMNDEEPTDDATGNPMEDGTEDATEAP
jgi:hypothetical protein